jgi:hypothetical protein
MTNQLFGESDHMPNDLSSRLRADPAMTRIDRVGVAIAMQGDDFTARDIARVTSLRMQTVTRMRGVLELPPLPRGTASYDQRHRDHGRAPRSLEAVAQALRGIPMNHLEQRAERLRISVLSAYGIRRAIDYVTKLEVRTDIAPVYRCANDDCQQLTPTHPCAHCGFAWLESAAA